MMGTSTLERTRGQDHGGHVARILETASFAAFDDQTVDTGVDGLEGGRQGRHDMEDRQTGVLEGRCVLPRIAGRRGHETHALLHHEVDDRWVADEHLRDIDAERPRGQFAHTSDLRPNGIQLARRCLDDAESSGIADGGRQGGAGDPAHGCLNDGVVDAEKFGDAIAK